MSASATRATSSIARRRFARFAVPALVTGLLTAACGGSPGGGTPAPLAEPIVTTLSGTGTYAFANGPGAAASFRNPYGVAVDSIGNVYVADQGDHRIRKITPDGTTTTLAGSGVAGFANGVGASAKFDSPNGITVDVAGNVYVADSGNYRIRKITPNGMVSTYAGISISRSDDGPISSASFVVPTDIAVDADGTMYVTDQNRVRKISTTGMVSTLAGSGTTGSANGTGAAASFDNVRGIDIDRAHNVYVTDSFNNKVRKISPTGVVSTFAGSGAFSTIDGPAPSATFSFPLGLAVDRFGNVFVADSFSQRVRRITPDGTVSSYAGSGSVGAGDGPASAATFNYLLGVAVDEEDTVFVGDTEGHRIRKITRPAYLEPIVSSGPERSGPAGAGLTLLGSAVDPDQWPLPLSISWGYTLLGPGNLGSCALVNPNSLTPTLTCTTPGRYLMKINAGDGRSNGDDNGTMVTFT